jgi:beta-carotene hydroxylase
LHHHAHFPAQDDIEGSASAMPWWRALAEGVVLQPRLLWFAFPSGKDRTWIVSEAIAVMILFAICVALIPITIIPAVYAAMMIAGSWIFPFITAYIPHVPTGDRELTRTKLFRGFVLDVFAMQHLYHLEHHLYPQVPHHNWPELARRLDPHFARAGLVPVKLFF